MNNVIAWIATAIVYGTVMMFGACGEIITEKSGHLNLGVPGIMYLSGFVGYFCVYNYELSTANPNYFLIVLIPILASLLTGALFGLLYSIMCVTFKCNQNVMGLLITSFGVGFGKFLSSAAGLTDGTAAVAGNVFSAGIPVLEDIPYIGPILFGHGFMVYIAVILAVIIYIVLTKTNIGLKLRSVGESPSTADAVGINVTKYKYSGTIIGCAITGLGGIAYILMYSQGLWSTNNGIEAVGWLSVALVIFACWKSTRLIYGSYLFGLLFWTSTYLPAIVDLPNQKGLSEILRMLPYLVTVVILIINSLSHKKENQAPSSLGKFYFREDR